MCFEELSISVSSTLGQGRSVEREILGKNDLSLFYFSHGLLLLRAFLKLNFIKNKKVIGHSYVKFHALQLLFGIFFNISYRSQFLPAFLKINSIKNKSDTPFFRKISRSTTFVLNFFRYLLSLTNYKQKTTFGDLSGLTDHSPVPT